MLCRRGARELASELFPRLRPDSGKARGGDRSRAAADGPRALQSRDRYGQEVRGRLYLLPAGCAWLRCGLRVRGGHRRRGNRAHGRGACCARRRDVRARRSRDLGSPLAPAQVPAVLHCLRGRRLALPASPCLAPQSRRHWRADAGCRGLRARHRLARL
eukprot:Amastigsp_a843318_215.p3 type:complete len:159 gc:universal Amastigsp_a843318_215:1236-760(-)